MQLGAGRQGCPHGGRETAEKTKLQTEHTVQINSLSMDFQLPCGRWRLHRGAGPRRPGAVAAPRRTSYRLCPGPNSKSFVAFVARQVPELVLDLPPTAIGKDYLGSSIVASAPSGRGVQFSLGGVFALTASGVEGLELNLLGLTFGINPFDPALKLPLLGRLGPARGPFP